MRKLYVVEVISHRACGLRIADASLHPSAWLAAYRPIFPCIELILETTHPCSIKWSSGSVQEMPLLFSLWFGRLIGCEKLKIACISHVIPVCRLPSASPHSLSRFRITNGENIQNQYIMIHKSCFSASHASGKGPLTLLAYWIANGKKIRSDSIGIAQSCDVAICPERQTWFRAQKPRVK